MEKVHLEAAQKKKIASSSILQCADIPSGIEYVQTWIASSCTLKEQKDISQPL